MSPVNRRIRHLKPWALVIMLILALPLRAAEPGETLLLVARPQLRDALYGSTILLVTAMPDGSSVGFIINKPTRLTLGQLFPQHAPSLKVSDPVFLGGPVGTNLVFALVERQASPGAGSIKIAPDLFLAIQADTVDRIIESESAHARFLVGMVRWRPGELNDELKRGLWYETKPDSELILRRKTEGMWEELVYRLELGAKLI